MNKQSSATLYIVYACTWLLYAATWAQGQEPALAPIEKVPPPAPPYLQAAPATAAWVITYPTDTTSTGSKAKLIKEVDVAKAGDVQRITIGLNDGTTQNDTWFCKGIRLYKQPGASDAIGSTPFGTLKPTPGQMDFVDVAWIGPAHFVGKTKLGKTPCYYYVMDTELGKLEAWIDVATGLPAAYRADDKLGMRTYRFTSATESTLTLPPEFQDAYDRYAKQSQALINYVSHIPR
jgi:hypothetical protein